MIISSTKLKADYTKFATYNDEVLTRKLSAIENVIREHTNNNFQNRLVRIIAPITGGIIQGTSGYLSIGDTIEINESINEGLYTIKTIDTTIETNESLYDSDYNLITKIAYPNDVIEGAIALLDWELFTKPKTIGLKSRTLSRLGETFADDTTYIGGYPAGLMSFCKNYMKARF